MRSHPRRHAEPTPALAATAAAALSLAALPCSPAARVPPLTSGPLYCRAASLGSNMPNPMRSVQNGKDDFQARTKPNSNPDPKPKPDPNPDA